MGGGGGGDAAGGGAVVSYAGYTAEACLALSPAADQVACSLQTLNTSAAPSIYAGEGALWDQVACYLWNVSYSSRHDVLSLNNYCTAPLSGADAFLFAGLALVAAAALFGRLSAVATLAAGGALGVLNYYLNLGAVSNATALWLSAQPADLFFYAFLPPLLLDAALHVDLFLLRRSWGQVLWLAFGLVAATCAVMAPVILYVLGGASRGWRWYHGALFAAMVAPTDAVAVAAVLRAGGAPARLITVLEGESLLNDASALTLFEVFLHLAQDGDGGASWSSAIGTVLWDTFKLTAIGLGVGAGFALGTGWFLAHLRWRGAPPAVESGVLLAAGWLAFYVANAPAGGSGVIAVVAVGLWGNATGAWGALSGGGAGAVGDHHHAASRPAALEAVWHAVAFAVNALVFFWSGAASVNFIIRSITSGGLDGGAWPFACIPAVYALLQAVRVAGLAAPQPLFRAAGGGLAPREVLFTGLTGLRGAVTLIMIAEFTAGPTSGVAAEAGVSSDIVLWASSFVLLTLCANAPAVRPLMRALALDALPPERVRLRRRARAALARFAAAALAALRGDGDAGGGAGGDGDGALLQGADWESVAAYTDVAAGLWADLDAPRPPPPRGLRAALARLVPRRAGAPPKGGAVAPEAVNGDGGGAAAGAASATKRASLDFKAPAAAAGSEPLTPTALAAEADAAFATTDSDDDGGGSADGEAGDRLGALPPAAGPAAWLHLAGGADVGDCEVPFLLSRHETEDEGALSRLLVRLQDDAPAAAAAGGGAAAAGEDVEMGLAAGAVPAARGAGLPADEGFYSSMPAHLRASLSQQLRAELQRQQQASPEAAAAAPAPGGAGAPENEEAFYSSMPAHLRRSLAEQLQAELQRQRSGSRPTSPRQPVAAAPAAPAAPAPAAPEAAAAPGQDYYHSLPAGSARRELGDELARHLRLAAGAPGEPPAAGAPRPGAPPPRHRRSPSRAGSSDDLRRLAAAGSASAPARPPLGAAAPPVAAAAAPAAAATAAPPPALPPPHITLTGASGRDLAQELQRQLAAAQQEARRSGDGGARPAPPPPPQQHGQQARLDLLGRRSSALGRAPGAPAPAPGALVGPAATPMSAALDRQRSNLHPLRRRLASGSDGGGSGGGGALFFPPPADPSSPPTPVAPGSPAAPSPPGSDAAAFAGGGSRNGSRHGGSLYALGAFWQPAAGGGGGGGGGEAPGGAPPAARAAAAAGAPPLGGALDGECVDWGAEARVRLVTGFKRYFASRRAAGLLSNEAARILDFECDAQAEAPARPLRMWRRLAADVSGGARTRALSALLWAAVRAWPRLPRAARAALSPAAGAARRALGARLLLACEVAVEFYSAAVWSPQARLVRGAAAAAAAPLQAELEAEADAAHAYVAAREVEAPDRFQAIQSYRAALALLRQQADFVGELFESGAIDGAEREAALAALDARSRRLEMTGPVWRPPRPKQVLRGLPALARLPPPAFRRLLAAGRVAAFAGGARIWAADAGGGGAPGDASLDAPRGGIWVVVSGVVRRAHNAPPRAGGGAAAAGRVEYFQGIGGVAGVLTALTGASLPAGGEEAVAACPPHGRGPALWHLPQRAVDALRGAAAAGAEPAAALVADLARIAGQYVLKCGGAEAAAVAGAAAHLARLDAARAGGGADGGGAPAAAPTPGAAPRRSQSVGAHMAAVLREIAALEVDTDGEDSDSGGSADAGAPASARRGSRRAAALAAAAVAEVRRQLCAAALVRLAPGDALPQATHVLLLGGALRAAGGGGAEVRAPRALPWWASPGLACNAPEQQQPPPVQWVAVGGGEALLLVCPDADGSEAPGVAAARERAAARAAAAAAGAGAAAGGLLLDLAPRVPSTGSAPGLERVSVSQRVSSLLAGGRTG